MKRFRPLDLLVLLGALFTIFKLFILLGGGPQLLPSIMIVLLPTLLWFIYDRWKQHAPTKPKDRVTEPADMTFDADAALARYLAGKKPQTSPEAGEQQDQRQTRPVFGAKKDKPD